VSVYKIQKSDQHVYLMPGADPGEGFQNTNYPLYSTDDPAPNAVPDNKGFVLNFKLAIATRRTDDARHLFVIHDEHAERSPDVRLCRSEAPARLRVTRDAKS
jgi:hypothetical protein